jgi:hypothetical protein
LKKSFREAAMTLSKAKMRMIEGYALPNSPFADLREFLDLRYGSGNWTQRTGAGVGTDIGPAINDALAALTARYGAGEVFIPPGGWFCKTPIDPVLLSGNNISGLNNMRSTITFDSASGSLFNLNGAGGRTGGRIKRLAIMLEDGHPLSTSRAIHLTGDTVEQASETFFEELYITARGNSYWYENVHLFGQNRTTPQGIRVGRMSDIQCFRARNYSAGFFNIVQWVIDNFGTYAGTGALANRMYIGGGGETARNTAQADFRRLAVGGQLNVTNCRDVYLNGFAADVSTASSATHCNGWVRASSLSGSFGTGSDVTIRS